MPELLKDSYIEGSYVTIHSIGPLYQGKEYRGIIRGISSKVANTTIWIVELVDCIDTSYRFSMCTMPDACIRGGWGKR